MKELYTMTQIKGEEDVYFNYQSSITNYELKKEKINI